MDREEIVRGTIGYGMPTPEEEFERVTGEVFDPEKYLIEWTGAENYGEDDTYTPYRIVRRQVNNDVLESSNGYSDEEVRRAYDNAVTNAIALIKLPEPTDSYEREAYNEEYLRRSEEIRRDLEILSDEQIREAEAEITRRTQDPNNLTTGFDEEVREDTNSDGLVSQDEISVETDSIYRIQSQFANYSDEDIENRLREIWEGASTFFDELSEDDPLYVEYWALIEEQKRRKNEEDIRIQVNEINEKYFDWSDEDIENRLREIWEEASTFFDELNEDDPLYIEYWELIEEQKKRKNEIVYKNNETDAKNDYSEWSNEDIERRLREIWEEASTFFDELSEDDPLYVEYWALITELNGRKDSKENDKTKKNDNNANNNESEYTVDSDGIIISFTKDDIKKGLDDYLKPEDDDKKKENDNFPIPVTKTPQTKNERRGILRRRHSRFRLWPLVVSAVMTIAAGLGFSGSKGKNVEKQIDQTSASYSVMQQVNEEVLENPEDAVKRVVDELKTGDTVEIPKGTEYFESSYHNHNDGGDRQGYIGNDLRQDGEYKIEYISIFYDGVNKDIVYDEGVNIQQEIENVANSLGVAPQELEVHVHIGGPVTGWIDYNDYVKNVTEDEKPDLQKINVHVVDGQQVKGHEDDFDGIISFVDENGNNATINFKKSDGSYYKVGDLVTASNGETYRVDAFDIKTSSTTQVKKGVDGKRKLNWKLSNINLLEALLAAGVSIIGIPLTYRREDEEFEVSEPEFYNIAGLEGYTATRPGSVWDYARSDFEWPGLTFETDKIAFDPEDEQIGFGRR